MFPSERSVSPLPESGELPAWATGLLAAARFVEDRLPEPVTVEEMAGATGYSVFYFSRVLSEATGLSPYDYLMRRRLSQAARLILESDQDIATVAEAMRFGSADTLSRAFRRMFGRLPSEVRKADPRPRLWLLSPLSAEYLRVVQHEGLRHSVRLRRGEIRLRGLAIAGGAPFNEEWPMVGPVVHAFAAVASGGLEPAPGGRLFAPHPWYLLEGPAGGSGEGAFFAGVEIEDPPGSGKTCTRPAEPPAKLLPPRDYMRFSLTGTRAEAALALEHVCQSWLPRAGVAPTAADLVVRFADCPWGLIGTASLEPEHQVGVEILVTM